MGILECSGICVGWVGIHRECPSCFWLFPMGEMLEHLWAWLDISAGVWLFPEQDLSSDLVFGVVMWGGGGVCSHWDREPGRAGMQGETSCWKLSPFSSPFKLSLKSKLVAVLCLGQGLSHGRSGEPCLFPPAADTARTKISKLWRFWKDAGLACAIIWEQTGL